MKLAAVCEAPPTLDPKHGDGSTLIAAHLLSRLPPDIELRLAYFDDRPSPPSPGTVAKASQIVPLRVRSRAFSRLAWPLLSTPRASWRRVSRDARRTIAALDEWADVVYLHGFHTFALADRVTSPIVAHEVDRWTAYLTERAGRGVMKDWYNRHQRRRAERVESYIAMHAERLILVNPDDAQLASSLWGRPVIALPNGSSFGDRDPAPASLASPNTIAFVGSLDYLPNVDSAVRLCQHVAPLIRKFVPDLQVVLAGRSPVEQVWSLASNTVQVHPDVPDMWDEIAGAAVLVFPDRLGQGTRNSLVEATAVGRPVVASSKAARNIRRGPHLLVEDDVEAMAARVVELLTDNSLWQAAHRSAIAAARHIQSWDAVSTTFNALLSELSGESLPQGRT